MNDTNPNYQIAYQYLTAVSAGHLPDELLTEDMTGWITSGGVTMDKQQYQGAIRLLTAMLETPLQFTVHGLTAEDDRVVIEASSKGLLTNGEEYHQTYVFILRLREGKIASIAEHYNAVIAAEKLVPLMAEAAKKLKSS